MNSQRNILLLICFAITFNISHAISFTNNRIEKLAHAVGLGDVDSLGPGAYDSLFYNNLKLNVRVNEFGEICHVGLKMFPKELSAEGTHYTWDFAERAFLERLVLKSDDEISFLHSTEKFKIKKGSPSVAASLPENAIFAEEHSSNFECSMKWTLPDGKTLLEVEFPRNTQMLMGSDTRQLERYFIYSLERTEPSKARTIVNLPTDINGTRMTFPAVPLLNGQITNSLHYQQSDTIGVWDLVDSADEQSKTLQNLMVATPGNFRDKNLDLTVDCYGYTLHQLDTTLATLKTLAQRQGCEFFFGIEGIDDDNNFIGLLVMLNREAGFLHKMDVKVPKDALLNNELPIIGRITLYIPLHNISEDYIKI